MRIKNNMKKIYKYISVFLILFFVMKFETSVSAQTMPVMDTSTTDSMTVPATTTETMPTPPAETTPSISDITVSDITDSSAWINVESDELVVAYLEYGTTSNYGASTPLTSEHSVSPSFHLTGLLSNTTYHFRVIAMNASGGATITADETFTTLVTVIEENAQTITQDQSAMTSTSTQASPSAKAGSTTVSTTATTSTTTSVSSHPILTPVQTTTPVTTQVPQSPQNVKKIVSPIAQSAISTGSGGGLPIAPFRPLILKVTPENNSVTFSWKKVSLNIGTKTLIVRKEGTSYVKSRVDGTVVYDDSGVLFSDKNVENGKEYHYALYVYGEHGRFSPPARFRVIPKAQNPIPSNAQSKTTINASLIKALIPTEFTRNLYRGTRGNDVSLLQQFLIDAGVYPEALITGYFGPLTQKALQVFQEEQSITPARGYLGPVTRSKITYFIRLQN